MPLYDYRCKSCGHTFERQLSMSDYKLPESEPCPNCSDTQVEKYIPQASTYAGEKIKPTGDFKEVIQKIKSNTYGNNLPDY